MKKLYKLKCKSNHTLEANLDKYSLALFLVIVIIITGEIAKYFKICLVSCYLAKCKLLTFSYNYCFLEFGFHV